MPLANSPAWVAGAWAMTSPMAMLPEAAAAVLAMLKPQTLSVTLKRP